METEKLTKIRHSERKEKIYLGYALFMMTETFRQKYVTQERDVRVRTRDQEIIRILNDCDNHRQGTKVAETAQKQCGEKG